MRCSCSHTKSVDNTYRRYKLVMGGGRQRHLRRTYRTSFDRLGGFQVTDEAKPILDFLHRPYPESKVW